MSETKENLCPECGHSRNGSNILASVSEKE